MNQGVPRRRRARPVGDAPVDALLARAESLTKGWLVALLEQTPLEEASAILAADLVRDGPRVCDAVVRALASDDDLRRLEPGGVLEPLAERAGAIAGAAGAGPVSGAIDALHAVIWSAVSDELRHPEPEQVSELTERLTLIIELVRGAALRGVSATSGVGRSPLSAVSPAEQRVAAGEHEPVGTASMVEPPDRTKEPGRPIELVRDVEPAAARSPEALWIGALEEEITRSERTGAPLSLLLVELEDADRVQAVEPPDIAAATLGRFAQAVRDAVRRPDIIASETETRAWVIARETSRSGAHALAARLGNAVRCVEPWRGAPMTVSIGLGVLGEDGRNSSSLIAAAEESRYAAAASGITVTRDREDEPRPEEPG
jgi:GGDEF domain-containing protein